MATRQTLRDFLTSAGSVASSVSMPVDPGSDGVIGEGDDLGVEPGTRMPLLDFDSGDSLLTDYTSYVTRNNDYPVAPGVHEAASTDRGSSLPTAETSSASRVFADSRIGNNARSMDKSNSANFDAAGYPLRDLVDKTGGGTGQDGDDLLAAAVGASANSDTQIDQSKPVVASFAVLKKYNNFSPTSSPANFSRDDSETPLTTSGFNSGRVMRVQTGVGQYEPSVVEVSADIDQDALASVARSVILKSAGWDISSLPADASDPNSAFDDVDSSTLQKFPNINRTQASVEPFRAQDSYGMPQSSDGSSLLSDRGDAINRSIGESDYMQTRGGTHTPDSRFGEDPNKPASERIQSLQAGIAMIGLATLIDKKLVNIEAYVSELQVSKDSVLRGPYYAGSSLKSKVTTKTRALVRSFMFQSGIYSYAACVSEGLYACLGFESFSRTSAVIEGVPQEIDTQRIATIYKSEIERIAQNFDSNFFKSPMGLSQGFWRAVSESAIRTISRFQSSSESVDGSDFAACLLGMKDSIAVKVLNVFASIGYQRLVIQGVQTKDVEENGESPKNPYDLDSYPSAPGTRQMKSRDGDILNASSLAWRNSALPSAFILPVEAMSAVLDMDYAFDQEKGANPIKGMLGSTLYDRTYVKATRNSNMIPPTVAKLLEDRLSAEYVPFYFRDLRTNEIIAFHAFLESLSDGFTANYAETRAFGRSDAVQNYSSTTRSIGLTFWIVSTSKEDFDEMWFKINKLTTLVYPQYTRGRAVTTPDNSILSSITKQDVNFEQPFSQLVGGTPVVRLRVGDVVKTNYTRSNFAKLFGVGNDTFFATSKVGFFEFFANLRAGYVPSVDLRLAPFLLYAASPMELTQLTALLGTGGADGAAAAAADVAAELLGSALVNGFVNPLLSDDRDKFFRNAFAYGQNSEIKDASGGWEEALETIGLSSKAVLKSRSTPYIITDKDGNNPRHLRLRRPVFGNIVSGQRERTGPVYKILLDDPTLGSDIVGSYCRVSAADLYVDSGQIIDVASMPGMLLAAGLITGLTGLASNIASNAISSAAAGASIPLDVPLADLFGSLPRTFTSPYNNPITRAFESKMGEGLAGVIKTMNFTWMDTGGWELDWNSRAPTACKVQISFAPIHDISPGLDSNGFNRAPIYNVGQIMHDSFGSPRSDGGSASRFFYKRGGAVAEEAKDPIARSGKIFK